MNKRAVFPALLYLLLGSFVGGYCFEFEMLL